MRSSKCTVFDFGLLACFMTVVSNMTFEGRKRDKETVLVVVFDLF